MTSPESSPSPKQDKDTQWDSLTEWSERHPYDPTLYANESEWRAANHINATRQECIAEAAGAIADYQHIDKAIELSQKSGKSIHETLVEMASSAYDESVESTLEAYEKMATIDTIEKEPIFEIGMAKGILQNIGFQQEMVSHIDDPTQRGQSMHALAELENEIEYYMATYQNDGDRPALSVFLRQELDALQKKAQVAEKLGKEPSIYDVAKSRGLQFGLGIISDTLSNYDQNKQILDRTIANK